eukprot:8111052-Pyramimonas_sp.AAC.1
MNGVTSSVFGNQSTMQHAEIGCVDLRLDSSVHPEHVEELTSYGGHLHSLRQVAHLNLCVNLRSLCVHGNALRQIEGLAACRSLTDLNLSSNYIERIEGLDGLHQLRFLNLSSNRLTAVSGLEANARLERLVLSHNYISLLAGLQVFQGQRSSLSVVDLRDNRVASMQELRVLSGIARLKDLRISGSHASNPVCSIPNFRDTLLATIPQLKILDQQPARTGGVTTSKVPPGLQVATVPVTQPVNVVSQQIP